MRYAGEKKLNMWTVLTLLLLAAFLLFVIYPIGMLIAKSLITNGEIDLIVNSPVGDDSEYDDSYLRKAAIKAKIPYITTIAAARATAEGILQVQKTGGGEVHSLQKLHGLIQDR